MKLTLIIICLFAFAFYLVKYHSPFQTTVTDPYYVEIRIDIHESNVQLVGFGKMNSYEDCQGRSLLFWMNILKDLGKVNVATQCKKEISAKYQKLFANEKMTATYVVYDRGTDGERDGRFLFYGIPSSQVFGKCEEITQKAKQHYSGKVYCIQGTVG